MDCRITSSGSKSGLTLVEMMVAIGIGSIVFAALGSLTIYSARSFSAMANYTDLNKENRHALDRMSMEIRQSRGVASRSPTNISFNVDGGGSLVYSYDKTTRTVTEELSGQAPTIVIDNCDFWTNEIFLRTPQSGSLQFDTTENVSLGKVVRFSWRCATEGSNGNTNSASAQSMLVVIRKKPD